VSAGILAQEWGTVRALWWRDLVLFARQRSRLLGALIPPLLIWLSIGAGLSPSFRPVDDVGYMEYFFPGVVLILLLQVAISATMSVIEDRRQGFLQSVLVSPGSRAAMTLGKVLGSSTVALLHAVPFLALAPLAGFPWRSINWPLLLSAATLCAIALTALGFVFAWWLDSIQGYHIVMNLLLFPAWILCGAMFPLRDLHPAMLPFVRWNPLTYAMAAMRRGFYGGGAPAGTLPAGSGPLLEIGVLVVACAAALWLAAVVTRRRRG